MSAVVSVVRGESCPPGEMGDFLLVESAGGTSLASRKGFVVVARPIGFKDGLVAVGETRFRKGLLEARVDEPWSVTTGQSHIAR